MILLLLAGWGIVLTALPLLRSALPRNHLARIGFMPDDKRLIEDYLPIVAISAEAT